MKKLFFLIITLLLLLPLCACGEKPCEHDWVLEENFDATCIRNGYQNFRCSLCGETFHLETDKAKGHISENKNPKIVTKATCTSTGTGTLVCDVCGAEYTVSLPKKDHNYENHICTTCGSADQSFFFTDLKCEKKSGEVMVFSANFNNYSGKTMKYVKVTLELIDDNGKIIDTDYTYAVGSEGIKNRSKAYFDLWYSGVSYYDIKLWSLEVTDYQYEN